MQYLAADGTVEQTMRQPIADTDPARDLDELAGRQLAEHSGELTGLDLPDQNGRGSWITGASAPCSEPAARR
ncbi:hypothetical protein UK12_33890 [Saccharothrix sp. ST-888]|nr:hypothetical protein UK12_33890 [Saccharothrix sp. ST-888]